MSNNGSGYHKNISNEDLLALIQQRAAELGRTPKKDEFDTAAATTAIRRFGKWNNFLASAGLETKSRGNAPMSGEEGIRLIQAKAAELGRTPRRTEFTQASAVIKKYGGWKEFLKAAGLKPPKPKEFKQISDEQLIKLVKARAAELGRTPKKGEFLQGPTAANRYGSWLAFLQVAKLEPGKVKRDRKNKPSRKQLSDEKLFELVQARAAELGRTPKRYEFAQGSTVTKRFGSWQSFLTSAGLEMAPPESYKKNRKRLSDKQLIELVQAQAAELGRIPEKYEFDYNKQACDRFGGWQSFLYRAQLTNVKPKVYQKLISNEEMVELVRAQAAELGRLPKRKEFKYGDKASRRYGGWVNFLQVADLISKQIQISEEELIKEIRKLAAKLGHTPQKEDFQYGNYATSKYGGWRNFIQAAGLPPCERKRHISDERLVGLIRAKTIELGRVPKKEEYSYCKTAISRFGGWQKFLDAAERMPAAVEKNIPKISNNQLLQLINYQAEELNRVPTVIEFEYAELAKERFRSWERFLRRAGLTPAAPVKPKAKISNEELIALVQNRAEELGHTPKIKEFTKASLAIARFGKWNTFIQSAGLEPAPQASLRSKISNEELIEWVQILAEELGYPPRIVDFEHGRLAVFRFGNWQNFLSQAGIEISARTRIKMSNEELIEVVKKTARELGRTPRAKEFEHTSVAILRFGKWSIFLKEAGLEPSKRKRLRAFPPSNNPLMLKPHLSDKELIEAVKYRAAEIGQIPRQKDFERAGLASYRFGTWNAFLKKAGML